MENIFASQYLISNISIYQSLRACHYVRKMNRMKTEFFILTLNQQKENSETILSIYVEIVNSLFLRY